MKSGYFEPFNCTIITVLSAQSSAPHLGATAAEETKWIWIAF